MQLVCFGDSNTYGYDPRSYFGSRYPSEIRWVNLLAQETGWSVRNEGQNGREIPEVPSEFLLKDLEKADALVIMLGSNDLLQTMSAETAARRMEHFLRQLPSLPTLLVAPPPMIRGAWVTDDQLLVESRNLTEAYRLMACKLDVAFADAGEWGVELLFDGVHFSEKGHQAFFRGISAALNRGFIREVRKRPALLRNQLLDVWESSVRASHTFLTEADLRDLIPTVQKALTTVSHLVVLEQGKLPVGFMGITDQTLEMLFLDPAVTGQGHGRRLLEWGIRHFHIHETCVNEQNPNAVGFYRHMGFRTERRTETDQQGRPFPLLYLRRED